MTTRPPAVPPRRRAAADLARRAPIEWRRYAARARSARRRLPRFEHPLAVSAAVSILFALAGTAGLQVAGVHVAASAANLARSVAGAIPRPTAGDIVLGSTPVNVGAAPVLDPLPPFTRTTALSVSGKVPTFAVKKDSTIRVALNGTVAATVPIAADGRFGPAALVLADGANTITASLVDGTSTLASTSASVVVERTPPSLAIVSPKKGDRVQGPDVSIQGKTDPGASVILNDHVLHPDADGTFTDRLTSVAPGPLAIQVVATDRAGNETKTEVDVTVVPAPSPAAAATTLALTLDRTTVKPGGTVVAQVVATEGGRPKADLPVTLQVGVITIGTYRTDASGTARVGFAAPDHEVASATVIVLGGGASATATLTVKP